jgi:tetrahydromethanopterin S-methyltransferase subunit G
LAVRPLFLGWPFSDQNHLPRPTLPLTSGQDRCTKYVSFQNGLGVAPMTVPPQQSEITERIVRELLTKAGATGEESDQFMDKLAKEILAGTTQPRDRRLKEIERKLDKLQATTRQTVSRDIRNIVGGVIAGLIANPISDVIGSIFTSRPAPRPPAKQKLKIAPYDIITVDWADIHLPGDFNEIGRCIAIGQSYRERRHGRIDPRVAVYLDASAMCQDMLGNHERAETLRRQALTTAQGACGVRHESVAAAHLNLGLSQFTRGKIEESDRNLAEGFSMMLECVGEQHVSTAAAIWTCYHCWKSRIAPALVPPQFAKSLPEIEKLAKERMALKVTIVMMLALIDVLTWAKEALAGQR